MWGRFRIYYTAKFAVTKLYLSSLVVFTFPLHENELISKGLFLLSLFMWQNMYHSALIN